MAEVIWIMTGRNDSAFLNYFNRQLPRFAGRGETYHGAYGYRLRRHLGVDQLDRAYNALRNKPASRQVVLQIWDSRIDLPKNTGRESAADIPCNVVSLLKVRGGKLEWMQIMRSNDVMLGLPYNFIQFTMLQEIMAGWLGLRLGSYVHVIDSLHVYERDLTGGILRQAIKPATNVDRIGLPKAESEKAFRELAARTEKVIDHSFTAKQLLRSLKDSWLSRPYRNILAVISAHGARRRGDLSNAKEILSLCSNSVYQQLCRNWLERRD